MTELYDASAPKRPANLTINSDLLTKVRSLNVNLSAILERALRDELAKYHAEQWREENKLAIQRYNDFVEENGCFGDKFREY